MLWISQEFLRTFSLTCRMCSLPAGYWVPFLLAEVASRTTVTAFLSDCRWNCSDSTWKSFVWGLSWSVSLEDLQGVNKMLLQRCQSVSTPYSTPNAHGSCQTREQLRGLLFLLPSLGLTTKRLGYRSPSEFSTCRTLPRLISKWSIGCVRHWARLEDCWPSSDPESLVPGFEALSDPAKISKVECRWHQNHQKVSIQMSLHSLVQRLYTCDHLSDAVQDIYLYIVPSGIIVPHCASPLGIVPIWRVTESRVFWELRASKSRFPLSFRSVSARIGSGQRGIDRTRSPVAR